MLPLGEVPELHSLQLHNEAMAEAPEVVTIPDDDDGNDIRQGPQNIVSVEEYATSLDDIMLHLKELVMEHCKDTLLMTINILKRRMLAQFEQMRPADIEIMMRSIKDTRCLSL